MKKKTKPAITIPDVKDGKNNTGLIWKNNAWYVRWTEDGKPKSISTGTDKERRARDLRDIHYNDLRKHGATVATRQADHKAKVAANPDSELYIIYRKPYTVRIGEKHIGEAETVEEAKALRNAHLGVKAK